MLPNKNMDSWRSTIGEHFSSREDGEILVFLAYVECGFRIPVHQFLPKVLEYYGVELVNLTPNVIANLSIIVYLCEAYLGILPNLKLFKYYYKMARSGKSLGSPGECTLRLHEGKADEYIHTFPKSS